MGLRNGMGTPNKVGGQESFCPGDAIQLAEHKLCARLGVCDVVLSACSGLSR